MMRTLGALMLAACCQSAQAGDMKCSETADLGARIGCYATRSVAMIAGASVLAVDAIRHALSSETEVRVELDDGRIVGGTMTAKAADGRKVIKGDLVKLSCLGAPQLPGANGFLCELSFVRKDTHASRFNLDHDRSGVQPSWSVALYDSGLTDEALLRLDEPIPLPR